MLKIQTTFSACNILGVRLKTVTKKSFHATVQRVEICRVQETSQEDEENDLEQFSRKYKKSLTTNEDLSKQASRWTTRKEQR